MYGLVLQGGGTKGSYHIGVWKALRQLNIEIGAVTGTSIGALNGAFIAQNMYDEALGVWENIKVNDVIDADEDVYLDFMNFDINLNKTEKYFEYFKKVVKDKGLDVAPLRNLIETHLDEDTLRNSGIDFGLVTVSLTDMKPMELFVEDIPKGKLTEYLLASAFLPGFKPQELDGKRFVDGGVYDNLPIHLITKKGYKDIIAVEMGSVGFVRRVKDQDLNIIKIQPSGDIGKMLQFDNYTAKRNIDMGYLDTMKVFGRLKGEKYYFKTLPEEEVFLKAFQSLGDDNIMKMATDLGIVEGNPKRILFEKLIPELAAMFDMDIKAGYREITLKMVEYLASVLEIERLKVYDYEEFEQKILEAVKDRKTTLNFFKGMPAFLKKSSLIKFTMKDDILIHWAQIITDSYLERVRA